MLIRSRLRSEFYFEGLEYLVNSISLAKVLLDLEI